MESESAILLLFLMKILKMLVQFDIIKISEGLKLRRLQKMLKKKSGQIDIFNHMIYEKLIPKDHLLVLIDSIIDFSFIYDKLADRYSPVGRGSEDPVMMTKFLLLEYIYNLSDGDVRDRALTDVAFRWFLGLCLDDEVPDDTTISHFRVHRLCEEKLDSFFSEIVKECIKRNLVGRKRHIIDTTDVAANVNYPSDKKLIRNAFAKVMKEVSKFNEQLAKEQLERFESDIQREYENNDKVSAKRHFEIAGERLEYLYLRTYEELQKNRKYQEAFGLCHDIVDQYLNSKKDKIVSVVDPDARIAHKSPGNIKRGYKDHIIVDEDSEIILASVQTPFNVGDEKKLKELVEKVEELNIKPKEVSADKVYGTLDNRAYLLDNEITSNIPFYNESSREVQYYGLKDFEISKELDHVTCPNGKTTYSYRIIQNKSNDTEFKQFIFEKQDCIQCPLKEQCLYKDKKTGKTLTKGRRVDVPLKYYAVLADRERVGTSNFEEACNKRFIIERRFASMVRKRGLRRCWYTRLRGAKTHIIMANMVCNIIRLVNIIFQPSVAMT